VHDDPALDVGAWDINSQQKQKQKVNESRVVHPSTMRIERNRCAFDSDSRDQKREKETKIIALIKRKRTKIS
jgi:hypothetical protein